MILLIVLVVLAAATYGAWRWAVAQGSAATLEWIDARFSRSVPVRMVAHGDSLLFPAAIRELAARHGGPGAGGGARWHAQLTEREGDVLRLMAKGRSNAEIAGDLFVSPQTVKTHVGNILGKLQARDRTQAVILAYETSFITPG